MSATAVFATPFRPKSPVTRRPAQWSKISLLGDASPWVLTCLAKISEFSQLPANWDSYGSNPISGAAVKMSLRFLFEAPMLLISEPTVSPVPGGGLGFHWRVENRDLELEFTPDGSVEYLKTDQIDKQDITPQEGTIQDLSDKRLWLWLAGEPA